ncbi:hypothetical protein FI667_g656, partial [Globisporangium splendens]
MARMTRARREALARFGAMFLTSSEDPSPPSSPLSSEGQVNSIEAIDGSASSVEIASVTTNVVLVADENPPNVVTMTNGGSAVCEDPPSELLGVRVDPAAGEKIVNGVEVEQFHVVWLEPNDKATGKARTSTTWEPEESFAMTEDGKDAIEILRKFNRARLTKPSMTFDQFIKTPEMRRGMTADDDGLCVFNSLKLALELAGVNVAPSDKAFESFKSKKKEKNINLSDGVNHKALCEFAKIITKLGVNLSLQDFKNRVTSAICGPDRLLELPLSDGIYLVGAYDQSSPPVGHCFALSVKAGTFYMVEKRQGIARFKLGRFGEVNVYGEWIHEIRFVLPVVVRLNKGKKSFK